MCSSGVFVKKNYVAKYYRKEYLELNGATTNHNQVEMDIN
jgi:hypothetical protein